MLRDAGPADALAGVHVRSWQAGDRGLLPEEYLNGLRAHDRAQRYTLGSTDPDQPTTIVAVNEVGDICGFVTTGPAADTDPATGQLQCLYVDPDCWGRGIGQTLIRAARVRLASLGFSGAVLWVLAGNDRAQRFYRADGWRRDGRHRHETVWGIRVEEICYHTPFARSSTATPS